ncbi:MAG: type II secretion system F family protein [Halobacteriovoraceae bacterium]|nr:type II secretion system F family protein [Halobacteriovoraceae bacterium]
MAKWHWKGLDKEGKKISGEIDADSKREVRLILRKREIRIQQLSSPSLLEFDMNEWLAERGFAKSFTQGELSLFTKQLAIMINAGIPLIQAFEILYKSTKSGPLKKIIRKVALDIEAGSSIADALIKQKKFSALYCNLIRAGEAAGTLDVILNKLSDFLEKQEKLKRQIKSAMNYPIFVSILGSVIVFGMMVFVVPLFTDMLKANEQEIPWITQMVLDISNFLQEWLLLMIPAIVILILFSISYTKSDDGKPLYDRLILKTPIFGNIIVKGNLSNFTMTLAITLGSGVPLIDALDICIETVGNSLIKKDLKKVKKAVTEGKTLTSQIVKIKYFPDLISQMIKVGEQTGSLDTMLKKVATVLEEEVHLLLNNMTKMIEPLVIVILGGIIAVVLTAMYLPIIFTTGGGV